MDQVSTPSRSQSSAEARSGSPSIGRANSLFTGFDGLSAGNDAVADPGEDPFSPGPAPSVTVDPLAEPLGALAGALLAMLTLVVPLLGVVSDRRDEPASSSSPERILRISDAAKATRP